MARPTRPPAGHAGKIVEAGRHAPPDTTPGDTPARVVAFALALGLGLGGCASGPAPAGSGAGAGAVTPAPPSPRTPLDHHYRVEAATAREEAKGFRSYRLTPPRGEQGDNLAQFNEVARHVETALSGRGYYRAPAGVEAELSIEMAYGAVRRPSFRTVQEPVYGMVGGGYFRTVRERFVTKDGHIRSRSREVFVPPRREIVGHRAVKVPLTLYDKHLRLTARLATAEEDRPGPPPLAWWVEVNNADLSPDLRAHLPFMAAAAMPHLAGESDGADLAELGPGHPDAAFVARGLPSDR